MNDQPPSSPPAGEPPSRSAPPSVASPAPLPRTGGPNWGRLGFTLSVLALGVAVLGWYRTSEAIDDLRAGQRALAANTAEGRRAPVLDLAGVRTLGRGDAVVTLIEFSDYECPFCLRHHEQTMPLIDANYIQTGKIRYVFRDWPVDQLHPQAIRAHEAAHCAGEQNKYWEMHRRLFGPAGTHTPDRLNALAAELGLDPAAFQACATSGRATADIRATSAQATELGATGTPTFLIGLWDRATSQVTVVRGLSGAQPYEVFAKALDEVLATAR